MKYAWIPWTMAAALCGCTNFDQPFSCQTSTQCVFQGQQGICEPNGFCSFQDTSCPSGARYGALAGGGLGGQCIDVVNPDSAVDGPDLDAADAADGPVDGPVDAADGPIMPTVLAMDQAQPIGIAVRDGNVYWTNYVSGGALMKKCTDCATAAAPLAAGQTYPLWIVIDPAGTNIYWANDGNTGGGIVKCSLPNCTGGFTNVLSESQGFFGLSLQGANLYWINKTAVRTCPASDCSLANQLTIATNMTFVEAGTGILRGAGNLVATPQGVFWARNIADSGGGSIQKCPLTNCNNMPATFAANQNYPWGLAVDGTDIYWTNRHSSLGAIVHCSPLTTAPCTPSTLAQGQVAPTELAVDATHVYWTNSAAGTVLRCSRSGCGGSPTVLASGQNRPYGIALDASYVFWANQGSTGVADGQVMRFPK